jgi:hypothetical protein
MPTLQIKNLAIALEALSRVQGSSAFSYDIEKLLQKEIRLEEENHAKRAELNQTTQPQQPTYTHDDIPF